LNKSNIFNVLLVFVLLVLIVNLSFVNHKVNVTVDIIKEKIYGNPMELKMEYSLSDNIEEDVVESMNRLLVAWDGEKYEEVGLHPYRLRTGNHYDLYVPEQNGADFYPFFEIAEDITGNYYGFSEHLEKVRYDEMGFVEVIDLRTGNVLDSGIAIGERGFNERLFGTSEFIKDGLLPLIDYGDEEAYDLAIELLEKIIENCGASCLEEQDNEVRGELLMISSRFGYEDYASLIYEISTENFDFDNFVFTDHSNEIIQGFGEYYLMEESTKDEITEILEGINSDDIKFFRGSETNYESNANYMLNAYYQLGYDLSETTEELNNLNIFDFAANIDDSADTIEELIYLNSIFESDEIDVFIETSMSVLLAQQKDDGFYTYTYLDGNVMRTLILFYLYKTGEVEEGYIPKINTFPTK